MREVRKVLLIYPPWLRTFEEESSYPPLGLCYIGGVLERSGYDVTIYNGDFDASGVGVSAALRKRTRHQDYGQALQDMGHPVWKEIESLVERQSPDLVGVSLRTVVYGAALNVSRIVKRLDPGIPVVWGGCHPTALPEACLGNPEVDIVVRGEGEQTMLEVVGNLDGLEQIPGITYRVNGQIKHNPDRGLLSRLDDLPFPARHLVLGMEKASPESLGHVLATRGCPYHCVYCASHALWSRKVRYRSVACIIDEMKQLERNYGVRQFSFEDDSFTLSRKLVEDFCEALVSQGLNYKWTCLTRVDLIAEDLVLKMKRAGCEQLYLGLESGNEESLKRIKKGITVEQMKSAAAILHRGGLRFSAFIMIGFPWETRRDIEDTLSLMKEVDPFSIQLSVVTPYPGTELWQICEEEGVIPENVDWTYFFHGHTGGFFSNRISREEASQIIWEAQGIAEKHNRAKWRQYILAHPIKTAARLIRGKYYYPSRLGPLIRYVTNL